MPEGQKGGIIKSTSPSFAPKGQNKVTQIIGKYRKEKGNLIPLLQEIQERLGYLPREAMLGIASLLEIPEVEVYGVATFYNQFRFLPLGKHHARVCMGTACHLRGGKLISEALERELDIKVGETTKDGNFSLERVACIGCCMLAPVMVIGDKIYPKMTPFKVEEALIPYKQGVQGQGSNNERKSKSKS